MGYVRAHVATSSDAATARGVSSQPPFTRRNKKAGVQGAVDLRLGGSKPYGVVLGADPAGDRTSIMRGEGLEPSRPLGQWLLRPPCLPFHHPRGPVRRPDNVVSLRSDAGVNRHAVGRLLSTAPDKNVSMRIGILTGGGDVPGLNPCIKAVVNRVAHDGHEVVGLRRGWAALLQHDPDDPASASRVVPAADAVASSARSTARAARSCTRLARTRAACGPATFPPTSPSAPRATGRSTSPITRCASSSRWASTS